MPKPRQKPRPPIREPRSARNERGQTVRVVLSDEQLAAVDELRDHLGLSRSSTGRLLIVQALRDWAAHFEEEA